MDRLQQGEDPDKRYTQWLEYPEIQRLSEFGVTRGNVDWFLVLLRMNIADNPYRELEWVEIAKFDHHPGEDWGHDITEERLHLDVYQDGVKTHVERGFPEVPVNNAISYCEDFFDEHYKTYVRRY